MKLAVLETSMGAVVLELYWDHAPKTCENFSTLCARRFYSGTIFHRLVPGFIIQGGDPSGTGRGGSSIFGAAFEDEIHPDLKFVGAGVLASANSGPNTNGSQFFISLAPTPSLNGKHTIFGRVHSGMRVIERLAAVAVDQEDRPRETIKILRSRVVDTEVDDEDLANV